MSAVIYDFDVVVIGAGHAGCEAALAAARVEEDLLIESVKVIVNLNAFAILAENKRVDIDIAVVVIADNIVKNNYINILPQSLAKYLYYIDILYNIKMTYCGCNASHPTQANAHRSMRSHTDASPN